MTVSARWISSLRRRSLVARIKVSAKMRHGSVEIDVAPGAVVSRGVRVDIEPGSGNRLVLGPASRLGADVLLWFRGGTIEVGCRSDIGDRVRMISSGRLAIGDDVALAPGVVVHCAEAVTVDDRTTVGEYTTVIDSAHRRTAVAPIVHHVRAAPTWIGRGVTIGPRAVVAHGVTVADGATIEAHAVVTADVPAGTTVRARAHAPA